MSLEPIASFVDICRRGGFDLVHAFATAWLDLDLGHHPLARTRGDLGLLVGHSRALWPPFLEQLDPRAEHPLDHHCEAVVTRAAASLGVVTRCFYSHHLSPTLPIQRLAEAVGFAALSPSHLSLHPQHGPWIGLRAVVVAEIAYAGPPKPGLPRPCDDCDAPCMRALERAVEKGATSTWRDWLEVRDRCPEASPSRYGAAQLSYHYTKERRWLDVVVD